MPARRVPAGCAGARRARAARASFCGDAVDGLGCHVRAGDVVSDPVHFVAVGFF